MACFSCATPAKLTKAEKIKEFGYAFLNAVEVEQTVYGIEKLGLRELNVMYGENPSEGRIRTIGLAVSMGHFLVTNYIWPEYREVWQNVTLGFKVGQTGWNLRIILRN